MGHKDIRFYDTSSLLVAGESLLQEDKFLISSETLNELEKIKSSSSKDPETKYSARHILRLLNDYPDKYEVTIHRENSNDFITSKDLVLNTDTKILSDAIHCNNICYPDEVVFVTNDLALKNIANIFFGNGMIQSVPEYIDNYTGYKEVIADGNSLEQFYNNQSVNLFNLEIGEYLILKNQEGKIVDLRVWNGDNYRFLNADCFTSKWFGKIGPKDVLQKCAIDSFRNNQLTYIGGKPGTGKTCLAIGWLFHQLDKGQIDQIVLFCNPVVAKNAAKLGYYPGSMLEKILSTQTGNVLASKLGDISEVERLVSERKLIIVPAGDARGYQTLPNSGIYIMEAQNYDVTLLRMLLQRVDETSVVICDGDKLEQTDLPVYSGCNNGLNKMSKVFRGQDYYGQVELDKIYRSKIAEKAQEMK